MALPEDAVNEFKEIFKKEHGKELSDDEAREYAQNLYQLVEVLYDAARENWKKDQKLKEFPKGYRLDENAGQYNCIICYGMIRGSEVWWDKSGPKCELCQKALWKKIIPRSVCKNRLDNWYAIYQLKDKFGISPQTAYKMIRQGKIKARIIPTDDGKPHYYMILKKENPNLVAYEEQHKYMAEKCKCPNSECNYCYKVVCLQKDCAVHELERKKEPRLKVIENLETERDKSFERSKNDKLDEPIRDFNKKDADEKQKYIDMLSKSIGIERGQKRYQKILIAGIPGMGKTTVGEELESKHDFKHVDFEKDDLKKFAENPDAFIETLMDRKGHVVITWGFDPENQTEAVLKIKNAGFKLVWFDGNKDAAKRAFTKRGTVHESAFYIQVGNIEKSHVVEKINPHIYNTFNPRGKFKDLTQIASDVQNIG